MNNHFPEQKKLIATGTLFILLVLLAVIFFSLGKKERSTPQPLPPRQEGETQIPPLMKNITLFFLIEGDDYLHPEKRDIPENPSISLMAHNLIQELLAGSRKGRISPFPPGTKLRDFYLTEEGTAYVDFSPVIKNNHPFGSDAEIATVYSIVNSLTYSFKEIKEVVILIDGRENQTLGGHINLNRPFAFRKDLIAQ